MLSFSSFRSKLPLSPYKQHQLEELKENICIREILLSFFSKLQAQGCEAIFCSSWCLLTFWGSALLLSKSATEPAQALQLTSVVQTQYKDQGFGKPRPFSSDL